MITPLHYASEHGHTDVIQLLIDHGADIDAKNKWGTTPLHLASSHGHTEIVKLLKANGAIW